MNADASRTFALETYGFEQFYPLAHSRPRPSTTVVSNRCGRTPAKAVSAGSHRRQSRTPRMRWSKAVTLLVLCNGATPRARSTHGAHTYARMRGLPGPPGRKDHLS